MKLHLFGFSFTLDPLILAAAAEALEAAAGITTPVARPLPARC